MKPSSLAILLALVICGCSNSTVPQAQTSPDSKLDQYFQRYCGYTGNMGIGFYAPHTYDYKYRQRLATTQDLELKRLFVLTHLYADADFAITDLEKGQIVVGKGMSRNMTPEERETARSQIKEFLKDLSEFDPGDPERAIAQFNKRLERLEHGPVQGTQ